MENKCCPQAEGTISNLGPLAKSAGFELLGFDLGKDVESAIKDALSGGAVFPEGDKPLSIFRRTLADSIRDIQLHPHGRLFQEFLLKGPYEGGGKIPKELTRSPTISPAFQDRDEMRGSGLILYKPRPSGRGVEDLTFSRNGPIILLK